MLLLGRHAACTAGAAGKLAIGFWDHWVPGANDVMTKIVKEWGDKNKVETSIDYITSVGNKNLLTLAAEAQAKTGHDIQAFPTWELRNNADNLEPMDDVVKRLSAKYGQVNPIVDYLAKQKNTYYAMPTISGSQYKPACSRLETWQQAMGWDLTKVFPAAEHRGVSGAGGYCGADLQPGDDDEDGRADDAGRQLGRAGDRCGTSSRLRCCSA